jgi:hypothetical protein
LRAEANNSINNAANNASAGVKPLPGALARLARGGVFLLFFSALLAASLPPRLAPIVSAAPSATAHFPTFVAVIPNAALTTAQRAFLGGFHEWKSWKPDRRQAATGDGAALVPQGPAPLAAIVRDRPRDGLPPATVRHLAFRHFDARGPPAAG